MIYIKTVRRLFFNSPQMKGRRKSLRNNSTKEEVILWNKLRNNQLGEKFTRQYSIGNYVVDFYCPKKRIAVELDGSQHNDDEKKMYDEERTEYINQFGVTLLRFWNGDVLKDIETVLEVIYEEINR